MSDMFNEVDEELRKERMEALWKKYGLILITIAVLIIAVVGGSQFWINYQAGKSAASGDKFVEALDAEEDDDAETNSEEIYLNLVEEGYAGYPLIAKFKLASTLLAQDKIEDAEKLYAEITQEAEQEEVKNLALIRYSYVLLEKGDISAVKDQLAAMSGVWSGIGKEVIAMDYLKKDEKNIAVNLFDEIARDINSSDAVRQRADKAIAVLSSEGILPTSE